MDRLVIADLWLLDGVELPQSLTTDTRIKTDHYRISGSCEKQSLLTEGYYLEAILDLWFFCVRCRAHSSVSSAINF